MTPSRSTLRSVAISLAAAVGVVGVVLLVLVGRRGPDTADVGSSAESTSRKLVETTGDPEASPAKRRETVSKAPTPSSRFRKSYREARSAGEAVQILRDRYRDLRKKDAKTGYGEVARLARQMTERWPEADESLWVLRLVASCHEAAGRPDLCVAALVEHASIGGARHTEMLRKTALPDAEAVRQGDDLRDRALLTETRKRLNANDHQCAVRLGRALAKTSSVSGTVAQAESFVASALAIQKHPLEAAEAYRRSIAAGGPPDARFEAFRQVVLSMAASLGPDVSIPLIVGLPRSFGVEVLDVRAELHVAACIMACGREWSTIAVPMLHRIRSSHPESEHAKRAAGLLRHIRALALRSVVTL